MMDTAARHRIELYIETAVVIAAVATIPLTIVQARGNTDARVEVANWIVWIVFFVEFLVLLFLVSPASGAKRRHLLNLTIVVLSFPLLPGALGVVRLVRLARLMRLVRVLGILGRGFRSFRLIFRRRGLLLIAVLTIAMILVGGGVMADIEPATVQGGYWSGVWWAVVTLTTGDISPATLVGRLLAVVLMFTGIGLVSTLAAVVAAYFVGEDRASGL